MQRDLLKKRIIAIIFIIFMSILAIPVLVSIRGNDANNIVEAVRNLFSAPILEVLLTIAIYIGLYCLVGLFGGALLGGILQFSYFLYRKIIRGIFSDPDDIDELYEEMIKGKQDDKRSKNVSNIFANTGAGLALCWPLIAVIIQIILFIIKARH